MVQVSRLLGNVELDIINYLRFEVVPHYLFGSENVGYVIIQMVKRARKHLLDENVKDTFGDDDLQQLAIMALTASDARLVGKEHGKR